MPLKILLADLPQSVRLITVHLAVSPTSPTYRISNSTELLKFTAFTGMKPGYIKLLLFVFQNVLKVNKASTCKS
jgi:hypothetical protein